MPAFGAFAGGLEVGEPVFRDLLAPPITVYVAGLSRLHAISHRRLARVFSTG
jgi:hypothetical protein